MSDYFSIAPCWQDFADVLTSGLDRIILYGPPGTGKTFAALRSGLSAHSVAERVICTEDLTTADITGSWMPRGEGRWEWLEGPAIRAWRGDGARGGRLVVDEVDRAAGDVLSLLLAMTDTDGSAQWRNPETGDVVQPAKGFVAVMTTNSETLEEIPRALRDRFPVAIRIDRPHPSSVERLSVDLRAPAMSSSLAEMDRRISLRTFYAFDVLRREHGAERAAQLLLGSQRSTSFLDALRIGRLEES